jgi:hypothetical protein
MDDTISAIPVVFCGKQSNLQVKKIRQIWKTGKFLAHQNAEKILIN